MNEKKVKTPEVKTPEVKTPEVKVLTLSEKMAILAARELANKPEKVEKKTSDNNREKISHSKTIKLLLEYYKNDFASDIDREINDVTFKIIPKITVKSSFGVEISSSYRGTTLQILTALYRFIEITQPEKANEFLYFLKRAVTNFDFSKE